MKKFTFILLLSIVFCSNTNAQLNSHNGHIMLKYSTGIIQDTLYKMPSLAGEFFITERKLLSLNYNFDWMFRRDSIRQFHSSMGAAAGPVWLILSLANGGVLNPKSAFTMSALLFILPDGISFHIPVHYKWDISPYANLLGFDIITNKLTNYRTFKYATSFGVKTSFYTASQFTFNSFIETRNTFKQGWSIGGGFGIGYAFNFNTENIQNRARFN